MRDPSDYCGGLDGKRWPVLGNAGSGRVGCAAHSVWNIAGTVTYVLKACHCDWERLKLRLGQVLNVGLVSWVTPFWICGFSL